MHLILHDELYTDGSKIVCLFGLVNHRIENGFIASVNCISRLQD